MKCNLSLVGLTLIATLAMSTIALAHGDEQHDDASVSIDVEEKGIASLEQSQLPDEIAKLGGPFSLINHLGEPVTDQTYAGKHMLVFFGYSNCQIMCSISLKRIGDALAILQDDADQLLSKINPLVITVDPANDTPERLRENLSTYHSALTGLTGTFEQLEPVYKAYGQKPLVKDFDLNGEAVVSHSSYFYLMGPDGKLQTFFPPIFNAETLAGLIRKYLAG